MGHGGGGREVIGLVNWLDFTHNIPKGVVSVSISQGPVNILASPVFGCRSCSSSADEL